MALARNDNIDSIIENLLQVIPIVHKRLMRITPPDIDCGIHLSRIHIGIMARLSRKTQPCSEIAREFLIPKPQMTYLINQLYGAGLVERQPNAEDRRIVDIYLTSKGQEIFRQYDEYLKDNFRSQLAHLTEKEIEEFATVLQKLKEIGLKTGRNQTWK